MPLTPPPDYTRVYVAFAIGASIALFTGLVTRSTLPTVGDLQHNLPHGGRYRDGTKSVEYCGPRKLNYVESTGRWHNQPWLLVIVLVALIIAIGRQSHTCRVCGRSH
uniref:Movement protein TGB2 n=1 Tax=Lily latent virus TaxID=92693 RepID=Q9QBW8_LSV|nr:12kDa protein [Lily latent virus]